MSENSHTGNMQLANVKQGNIWRHMPNAVTQHVLCWFPSK